MEVKTIAVGGFADGQFVSGQMEAGVIRVYDREYRQQVVRVGSVEPPSLENTMQSMRFSYYRFETVTLYSKTRGSKEVYLWVEVDMPLWDAMARVMSNYHPVIWRES